VAGRGSPGSADAAAYAAGDHRTPRGRKLRGMQAQLVSVGCPVIARPGRWPGRHRPL